MLKLESYVNYFSLFGLPVQYQIDIEKLFNRFRELQHKYHPDKFISCSQEEKLAIVQKSAVINQAWQSLRNPLSRAEHLILIKGFDIVKNQYILLDKQFLIEQISLYEALDKIKQKKDKKKLNVFIHQIKNIFNIYYQQMVTELNKEAWKKAANSVCKLRFLEKLRNSAKKLEEKL